MSSSDDDDDILDKLGALNRMIETSSLLPDRQYIIFNELDDDNVSMSVYDTTEQDPEETEPTAGDILLHGVLEMMENRMEEVLEMGLLRLSMLTAETETLKLTDTPLGDNIVKVDFGKKH
jgi:hypothetical protein